MFPGNFVVTTPDKPAVIRPSTGERLTYRELDERSTRLARHLRSLGLKVGDHLALVSSNDLRSSRCTGRRCDPGCTSPW